MQSPSSNASGNLKPNFSGLYRSLAIDFGIPIVVTQVLIRHGVALIPALAISAVFPAASAAIGMVRRGRLDFIAMIALFFITIGILTSFMSGDPRFALAKESAGTGVFALICLGSLLAPRPLMFTLGREFATGNDPMRRAEWDGLWSTPYFRFVNRVLTIVWGVVYLAEALLRVALALTFDPSVVSIVSPLLAIVTTLGCIAFTIVYARHARRRGEQLRAQASQSFGGLP